MSVTQTSTSHAGPTPQTIYRTVLSWTSDASGTASGSTTEGPAGSVTGIIAGILWKVQIIPGEDERRPVQGWQITITDSAGVDILEGFGGSIYAVDPAKPTVFRPAVSSGGYGRTSGDLMVADVLKLNVSGAGPNKSGKVILYVRS